MTSEELLAALRHVMPVTETQLQERLEEARTRPSRTSDMGGYILRWLGDDQWEAQKL